MPIDLSSGLVPKSAPQPVDLSAGLVAKAPEQQQGFFSSASDASGLSMIGRALLHPLDTTATVLDAAKRVVTPGQPEKMSDNPNPIIAGVGRMIDSTVENAKQGVADYKATGMSQQTRRDFGRAVPIVGPALAQAQQQYDAGNRSGAAGTVAGTVGGLVLGPKVAEGTGSIARSIARLPGRVAEGAGAAVVGSNIDRPIPGETVTPRQQFAIARDQGVNLDAAQATGSPVLNLAKKVTDSSLGGAPAYHENFAQNVNALQVHAEDLLDQASPQAMTREEFGNAAKGKLLEDLQSQKDEAGKLYDELSQSVGTTQPSVKGIQAQAKQIVDANAGYYAKHPDMLKGGASRAWQIVKNLAEAPAKGTAKAAAMPADTWTDLHMLRSDLMDITRGPEFIGSRPEGWVKQMTGAVDDAMSNGASGLGRGDLQKWRDANALYEQVKQTYDNPQHPLYHVVRAPDGVTAADRMANLKPQLVRQIGQSAPDLIPQLQRQTIDRMLRPSGNDVPDLKNLPSRFNRTQKEQLGGVLSPQQMINLENLARTSRMVHATDNASGTAIKGQAVAEGSAIGAGLLKSGISLVSGDPIGVAEGLAPAGWYGGTKVAGKAMNSPAVVDRLMQTPGPRSAGVLPRAAVSPATARTAAAAAMGQARWMQLGAAKLQDHIGRQANAEISAADVDTLKNTPAGQQLLIQASDLPPGSAAMRNLVKQIQALKQ